MKTLSTEDLSNMKNLKARVEVLKLQTENAQLKFDKLILQLAIKYGIAEGDRIDDQTGVVSSSTTS